MQRLRWLVTSRRQNVSAASVARRETADPRAESPRASHLCAGIARVQMSTPRGCLATTHSIPVNPWEHNDGRATRNHAVADSTPEGFAAAARARPTIQIPPSHPSQYRYIHFSVRVRLEQLVRSPPRDLESPRREDATSRK